MASPATVAMHDDMARMFPHLVYLRYLDSYHNLGELVPLGFHRKEYDAVVWFLHNAASIHAVDGRVPVPHGNPATLLVPRWARNVYIRLVYDYHLLCLEAVQVFATEPSFYQPPK